MKIEMDAVTSEVMSELELTQHDFWNVSRQTGIVLNTFVKMVNAKNVLEIGTSNGYSGLWIAKALQQLNFMKNVKVLRLKTSKNVVLMILSHHFREMRARLLNLFQKIKFSMLYLLMRTKKNMWIFSIC